MSNRSFWITLVLWLCSCMILTIVSTGKSGDDQVGPINLAYYRQESNSFVVTCRISAVATIGRETASTCDFLIELDQVNTVAPDYYDLFATEQWVMLKANQVALEQQHLSLQSASHSVLEKIAEFPREFNAKEECFTLFWYTKYSERERELQFRVLMQKEFQQKMTQQKCVLYPWNLIYPKFMRSNLSLAQNYIEIRFSMYEDPITDQYAEQLRKKAEWQYVSMEITHIYVSKNVISYYIVIDMTDGNFRWYVWKNDASVMSFLNETFKAISYEFDKFKQADHFAQITSMLLTKRAHNGHTIDYLKKFLTVSDKIKYETDVTGKQNIHANRTWTAKFATWQDTIKPKLIHTMCHYIDNTEIQMEIQSFVIKNNAGAKLPRRREPVLPNDDPSISPGAYPENIPLDSFNMINHLPYKESGSSESDEDEDGDINHCYGSRPIFLRIKGGPEILQRGSMNNLTDATREIFKVPRRKRRQMTRDRADSGASAHSMAQLPNSLVDHLTRQQSRRDVGVFEKENARMDEETQMSEFRGDSGSRNQIEEYEVVYVVLYEGKDHSREARLISFVLFMMVFILSCIGFGCIIIEQTQIKRRSSSSSSTSSLISNSHSANNKNVLKTPPKRIRPFH